MRILDRFRRKKEDVLPEEVEKYYQSQRRARVGTAWILGFLTLVITLVIALGLFYGGRYVYREITGSDETAEISTDQGQGGSVPQEVGQSEDESENQQNGRQQERNQNQNQRSSDPGSSLATGDRLPSNGDGLPATGDPGR